MGPHEPLVTVSPPEGCHGPGSAILGAMGAMDSDHGGHGGHGYVAQGRAPLWGRYSRERLAGVISPYYSLVGSSQMAPNLGTRLCPLPGSPESPVSGMKVRNLDTRINNDYFLFHDYFSN